MYSVNGLTRRTDSCSTVISALFRPVCILCVVLVGLTRRLDRCSTLMLALYKPLCVLCAGLVGFARRLDSCSTVMSALYKPLCVLCAELVGLARRLDRCSDACIVQTCTFFAHVCPRGSFLCLQLSSLHCLIDILLHGALFFLVFTYIACKRIFAVLCILEKLC